MDLSPTLDAWLTYFATIAPQVRWQLHGTWGRVRTDGDVCPLQYDWWVRTGQPATDDFHQFSRQCDEMGLLPWAEARLVMDAADMAAPDNPTVASIRARLLAACGLEEIEHA